jgi:APA family basic amino acid/polyamine antiporter
MSRDGLLPSHLALVHKRFKTPWINTIIVGVLAVAAAGFMPLDRLSELTNVGSLAAFAMVCATVIYLRVTHPTMVRPFRTPLYPLTPILGVLMCLFLLMSLMAVPATRNFFIPYMLGGIVVYFAFGMWNSKLGRGLLEETPELAPMQAPHPEP